MIICLSCPNNCPSLKTLGKQVFPEISAPPGPRELSPAAGQLPLLLSHQSRPFRYLTSLFYSQSLQRFIKGGKWIPSLFLSEAKSKVSLLKESLKCMKYPGQKFMLPHITHLQWFSTMGTTCVR